MKQILTPPGSAPRPPARKARAASGSAASRQPAVDPADLPKLGPRRQPGPWIRRLLVFATCVLMVDALFGDRGLAETMRARRAYQQAEMDLGRMQHENAELREEARRLRDDPGTIESVAREELGMIRGGEILIVIKDLE